LGLEKSFQVWPGEWWYYYYGIQAMILSSGKGFSRRPFELIWTSREKVGSQSTRGEKVAFTSRSRGYNYLIDGQD